MSDFADLDESVSAPVVETAAAVVVEEEEEEEVVVVVELEGCPMKNRVVSWSSGLRKRRCTRTSSEANSSRSR